MGALINYLLSAVDRTLINKLALNDSKTEVIHFYSRFHQAPCFSVTMIQMYTNNLGSPRLKAFLPIFNFLKKGQVVWGIIPLFLTGEFLSTDHAFLIASS